MASMAANTDVVNAIATEISRGVERAMDRWMSQFDSVLRDTSLTSLSG